jgi:hypothetical protein
MEKIIPSNPAKYPPTNISESRAITIFRYILSEYVKVDIREMDKVPNYDGYLEIINQDHVPVGKLEIQMKKMSDEHHEKPKYQCSLEFLSYCESCTLPIFLILVDTKNEVAYWLFISRKLLKILAKRVKKGSESINVKIPLKNIIRQGNAEYLVEWQRIIDEYRTKIYFYDDLQEKYTDLIKDYDLVLQENSLGMVKI